MFFREELLWTKRISYFVFVCLWGFSVVFLFWMLSLGFSSFGLCFTRIFFFHMFDSLPQKETWPLAISFSNHHVNEVDILYLPYITCCQVKDWSSAQKLMGSALGLWLGLMKPKLVCLACVATADVTNDL